MNIHRALLGVFDGVPYLGSLDFLSGQARLAAWPSATQQVESEQGTAEPPPPMDLVIMNPPFTRDSLRHDQFNRRDEQAIKRREKELFSGRPTYMAGNSGAFLVLADHLNEATAGTVATILPLMGMTDKSGLGIRKFLGSRYYVDTIVSSHDPARIFFSENTSIGEVLVICRRWDRSEPKPPTRVVNLARNPVTPLEALDTATRIERAGGTSARSSHDFTVQRVDSERIERGDWFAVNFLSPFLVDAYRTLSEAGPLSVSTVPLRDVADIGPEGRRIRDTYTPSDMPTKEGRRALWYNRSDITRSMLAETDVYIEPKPSRRRLADSYWEQRSELLLPHRLRLNLARVASVILPERAVGSRWTPCRPHDPDTANALCLYLNSTPGLLSLLGGRDNRVPSYPSFSLDTLRSLPVPNFADLGAAECDLLEQLVRLAKGRDPATVPADARRPGAPADRRRGSQSVRPGPRVARHHTPRAGAGTVGYRRSTSDRVNPQMNAERLDPESEQIREVFARFGLAMYNAQGLERELVIILATKYGPGPSRITKTQFDRIFERLESKTLGHLVDKIAPEISEDEQARLKKALEMRNWLAHGYFWERAIEFPSESGRSSMIEELQEAADEFDALDKLFTARTLEWGEAFGITRELLEKELERLLQPPSDS